jgi:hypothetical protein
VTQGESGLRATPGVPQQAGVEIARLVPPGAHCALLNWPQPADDDAESVPAPIVAALCAALSAALGAAAAGGGLAFRWHDQQPLPAGAPTYHPAPRRSLADWLLGWAWPNRAARFGVIVTSDATVAPALFEWIGWDFGAQMVLVHGAEPGDAARAVAALQRGQDWRRAALPQGTRLLFGGGHDGAFGLVAARDADALHQFCAAAGAAIDGGAA